MKKGISIVKKFLLQNWKWIVLFLSVVSFLIILEDVIDKDIINADSRAYEIVSTYLISDSVTPIMKVITNFGGIYWLLGLSLCLLLIIKNKRIGISIFLNLGFATITNYILKLILQRPRPIEDRIIDETGYSFPSGHSMVSMAFYGFLIYLVYKYVKNKYLKLSIISILSLLIISIGLSRIYLGVHYTSDVIAGFLIAITYLIIFIKFISSYIDNKK